MKKIIFATLLTSLLVVGAALAVSADSDVNEGYHTIEGMQRVTATSSMSPDYTGKGDTSLVFDHDLETSCSFDLSGKEKKIVTIQVGSLKSEIIEKFSGIFTGVDGTEIAVAVYATDDPTLSTWTQFAVKNQVNDGKWSVFKIDGIEKGYAFYRFEFEILEGDSFTVSELALFRTMDGPNEDSPLAEVAENLPLYEKEQWRKVVKMTGFMGRRPI